MMRDVLAEALRRQAAHERHMAALWLRSLRWYGLEHRVTWPDEYRARAELFDQWAQAVELDLPIDFIRYGCSRDQLGDWQPVYTPPSMGLGANPTHFHRSLLCLVTHARGQAGRPCSGTCDGHGSGAPCDEPCGCFCHAH